MGLLVSSGGIRQVMVQVLSDRVKQLEASVAITLSSIMAVRCFQCVDA